jgi:uncharacterized protein
MVRLTGPGPLKQVTLVATEQCNQRCAYCYVPVERAGRMSPETVRGSMELLFAHAPRLGSLSVSFFGGEPFLAPELMREAHRAARELRKLGQRISFSSPTNATAFDDEKLALAREIGLELAVSIDGEGSERRLADGRPAEEFVRRSLPRLGGLRLLARMTVTPRNVASLAQNVGAIFALGFSRIVFLPSYEDRWDASSIEQWRLQTCSLAEWLVARIDRGQGVPELPAWRGLISRLDGAPRQHCGAGVSRVSIAVDGEIFPCYRTVYDPQREPHRLGRIGEGFTNLPALEAWARLDVEHEKCATCSARDGCGFFCPALGLRLTGDINGVPEIACELARAEVEACRILRARVKRGASTARRTAAAASAALALVSTGVTACFDPVGAGASGSDASTSTPDGAVQHPPDAAAPGADASRVPPAGVCAYQPPDAATPVAGPDVGYVAGVCAYEPPDAGAPDVGLPPGGLCPYMPPDDAGNPGGLC